MIFGDYGIGLLVIVVLGIWVWLSIWLFNFVVSMRPVNLEDKDNDI